MKTSSDSLFAILFVADSPVPAAALASALSLTEGQVEQGIEVLRERLDREGPLQLVKLAGGFQLSTRPEYAETIAAFLRPQRQKLSRSLMEVLAVVAYRQPLTLSEIDEVRGVQSDHSARALLERRLIQEVGRKQTPGRPILYGTTKQFLHQFNMDDLADLPKVSLEAPLTASALNGEEPIG